MTVRLPDSSCTKLMSTLPASKIEPYTINVHSTPSSFTAKSVVAGREKLIALISLMIMGNINKENCLYYYL